MGSDCSFSMEKPDGNLTTTPGVLSRKFLTIRPPIHPLSLRSPRSPTLRRSPALRRLASRATRRSNSGNLFPGQNTRRTVSVARQPLQVIVIPFRERESVGHEFNERLNADRIEELPVIDVVSRPPGHGNE